MYTHLRLYISYHKYNARILNYWSVVYLYIDKVHLGTDSKWRNKKQTEIPCNPSQCKNSYLSEKNILITRSTSKFISLRISSNKASNLSERDVRFILLK